MFNFNCLLSTQAGQIAVYGFFQAQIEGVADEGVPYRHLVEIRQTPVEVLQVLEAEVMACVSLPGRGCGHL